MVKQLGTQEYNCCCSGLVLKWGTTSGVTAGWSEPIGRDFVDRRIAWISCLSAAVMLMVSVLPCLAAQKRILLIQSYDPSLPWTVQCERGIRSVLPESVSLDIVYLDTKTKTPADYRGNVDAAMASFERTKPDLVMLGDDNALRILGPTIADTGVPVVYFGINNNPRSYFTNLPANVVGVIERIPLFHWVRVLTGVVPDAQNILVLMDDSPTAKAIFDTNFMGRQSVAFDGRTVSCALIGEWARWQDKILADGYDFILMPIYHALKDRDGGHVDYQTVVTWTSEHSAAYLFSPPRITQWAMKAWSGHWPWSARSTAPSRGGWPRPFSMARTSPTSRPGTTSRGGCFSTGRSCAVSDSCSPGSLPNRRSSNDPRFDAFPSIM